MLRVYSSVGLKYSTGAILPYDFRVNGVAVGLLLGLSLRVLHHTRKAALEKCYFRRCWKWWIVVLISSSLYAKMNLQLVFGWNTKTWVIPLMRNWCMRVENLTGNLNVIAPENSVYWLWFSRNSWEKYREQTNGNVFSTETLWCAT